jgi:hypothetical protein
MRTPGRLHRPALRAPLGRGAEVVAAGGATVYLRLPVVGRIGQGEEHDLFTGHRADVVVQADHLNASDLVDHRFQEGSRRFRELSANLLEQVPALLGRERLDQVLFGGGKNALESDQHDGVEDVGVDVLGAAAHVFLLERGHPIGNGGLDFSLRLHQFLRIPTVGE